MPNPPPFLCQLSPRSVLALTPLVPDQGLPLRSRTFNNEPGAVWLQGSAWVAPAATLHHHLEEPSEPAQRFFQFLFKKTNPPLFRPASPLVTLSCHGCCLQRDVFLILATKEKTKKAPAPRILLQCQLECKMPASSGRATNFRVIMALHIVQLR